MRIAILGFLVFFSVLVSVLKLPTQYDYDVVIYGGTPGGIIAAVAASRMGQSVAIIEPTKHIGGMVTSGLGVSDIVSKEYIGGITREFFQRVGQKYNQHQVHDFEPHVAEKVFTEMIEENGIDVYFGQYVTGVRKKGLVLEQLSTDGGRLFRAKVFMDASYEGDVIAHSGVSYKVGRESAWEFDEPYAGFQIKLGVHHFEERISGVDGDGDLLPEIHGHTKDFIRGKGDAGVGAYCYRLIVTKDPNKRVPFPKPKSYDKKRFRVLARYLHKKGGRALNQDVVRFGEIPNKKFVLNNRGPFSFDYIGGNWEYPDASPAKRRKIIEEHKEYTLQLIYFLQNDERVPQVIKDTFNKIGLSNDEFVDNDFWPYQLYIREARRMVGEYIMRQQDTQTSVDKPDTIGIGTYRVESHHVHRLLDPNGHVMNEGYFVHNVRPYEVPYRSLTPLRTEAKNLLVPVPVSATHVAFSGMRMEPIFMRMGHAAGVAAHLAIENKTSVQEVEIKDLQKILINQGQILHSR